MRFKNEKLSDVNKCTHENKNGLWTGSLFGEKYVGLRAVRMHDFNVRYVN